MIKTFLTLLLFAITSHAHSEMFNGAHLVTLLDAHERAIRRTASAEDYQASSQIAAYTAGAYDSGVGILFCPSKSMNVKQLMVIAKKFLHRYPERLNESGARLIIDSLQQAFPCPRKTRADTPLLSIR